MEGNAKKREFGGYVIYKSNIKTKAVGENC